MTRDVTGASYVHLFVPRCTGMLEGAGELVTGDAVRITAGGGQQVIAGRQGAEILVWEMRASVEP